MVKSSVYNGLPSDQLRDTLEWAARSVLIRRAFDPWFPPHGVARPNQIVPDGTWSTALFLGGRGAGKTRAAAEWVRRRIQNREAEYITITGPTAADVRDVMVEGESGILAVCDRVGLRYDYQPSKRRITFPDYRARAILVSADRPDRYRGLQHDTVWADEIAAWRYADDAWTQLMLGLRLGDDPRAVAGTTPRPTAFIKSLVADPGTVVLHATTYENLANLAPRFRDTIIRRYEGTTLGRQELLGEIVEDVEGALWTRALIDRSRITDPSRVPHFRRVVVAVDPATTHGEQSDETGIAVAAEGTDGDYYVLHISGLRASPERWASEVVALYAEFEADEIVAEANQGGEMVRDVIRHEAADLHPAPRVRLIHASRGKTVRAEPVVLLYERGKVHHVGLFPAAEDQMTAFPVASDNDDQVDALVHALVAVSSPRRTMRTY